MTVAFAGSTAVELEQTSLHSVAAEGVRDITPMVIGVIPFALAIGAAIGSTSLSSAQGVASAPVILAGAAQLTTVQMLDSGAGPFVIVLSALMINARLLLYSASLAQWFCGGSMRQRMLLAVPVIDQLHFTCVPRFEQGDLDRRGRIAYYTGAAGWLVSAWVVTQSVAIVVGAQAPESIGLRVAAPLALAGLLAKSIPDRRSTVAAVVAAVVAVVGVGMPFHSAVLVAALAGMAGGIVSDRMTALDTPGSASDTPGSADDTPGSADDVAEEVAS